LLTGLYIWYGEGKCYYRKSKNAEQNYRQWAATQFEALSRELDHLIIQQELNGTNDQIEDSIRLLQSKIEQAAIAGEISQEERIISPHQNHPRGFGSYGES
jgi:hypothetical protein